MLLGSLCLTCPLYSNRILLRLGVNMTSGVIRQPTFYKEWSGSDDSSRKKQNSYVMNTATISTTRFGDTAEGFIIDGITHPNQLFRDEQSCQNDCVTSIREEGQSIDVYAFLRDLPNFVALATKRLKQVYSLTRALKHRDIKAVREHFEDQGAHSVPAAWLEWHFAVSPTFGDMKVLSTILSQEPPVKELKQFSKRRGSAQTGNPIHFYDWEVMCEIAMGVRGINPNIGLAQQLGLMSVAGTAWELTPWSWAIDYFSNVGDVIGNFQPHFSGWDIAYVRRSRLRKLNRAFPRFDGFANGDIRWSYVQADAALMRRDCLASLPNVVLQADFKLNLQRFSYLSSAIALTLRGKFRG